MRKIPEILKNKKFQNLRRKPSEALKDCAGFCLPGLVDIHIHGAFGWDFSFGNPEKINEMLDRLMMLGLTGVMATMITCPEEQRLKALNDIASVAVSRTRPPAILGIYMEGPFLSPARCGSHQKELLLSPDLIKVEKWQKEARGLIKMITIAPELPQAIPIIRGLKKMEILAAMGHTDADHATAQQALKEGCLHVTHLFNAMRPFTHRDPTVVSAILSDDRATAELIGDCIHVSPEIMEMTFSILGSSRIALISDAVCPMGLPDGIYRFYENSLEIKEGKCCFTGGHLFGGGRYLSECLKILMERTNLPLFDLADSVFKTPCRILGIKPPKGKVYFDNKFSWLATRFKGNWYTKSTDKKFATA